MTRDDTGFDRAPDRYTAKGRETVDKMRDECRALGREKGVDGDLLFAAACLTHHMKYLDRVKNPDTDPEKAEWWLRMYFHVLKGEPDPRSQRPGFEPYEEAP